MEQHMPFLMWLKSKQIFKASMNSFNNTWEEQAFADDAAGPLGGFVWPPRSYSCTFCRREFRSAQALGGHMNVHRKDRARLKQSLGLQNDQVQPEKRIETPGTQHLRRQGGCGFSSSAFSSKIIIQENSGRTASGKCTSNKLVTLDHSVETNLSVGINFGGSHNVQLESVSENTINSKRHKSSGISSFAFFHKPGLSDRYVLPTEVLRINTKSMEDIDLELRLGDPPAVK